MRPILFEVFGLPVYSYGFLLAITIIIGTFMLVKQAGRIGITRDQSFDFVIIAVIFGAVSSRAFYILTNLDFYVRDPLSVFALREGGLSIHGAIFGGALVAVWFARRNSLRLGDIPDALAPVLALGVGLVRIGCLLNGCCYGIETDVPWGVLTRYAPGLRHPTQLYESIGGFLLFLLLWEIRNKGKWSGYHFTLFVTGYSAIRFLVEFWRESQTAFLGLSVAQVASVILIICGLVVMRVKNRRHMQNETV